MAQILNYQIIFKQFPKQEKVEELSNSIYIDRSQLIIALAVHVVSP